MEDLGGVEPQFDASQEPAYLQEAVDEASNSFGPVNVLDHNDKGSGTAVKSSSTAAFDSRTRTVTA